MKEVKWEDLTDREKLLLYSAVKQTCKYLDICTERADFEVIITKAIEKLPLLEIVSLTDKQEKL